MNIIVISILFIIIFILNFYKMPQGTSAKPCEIIAPSYGTVYSIDDHGDYISVVTFLSPFDVHMQYCPVNGVCKNSIYDRTGNFDLAFHLNKSKLNEKRIHTFDTKIGEIRVYQVAGFLTRRIESWIQEKQAVLAGQPLGIIHLGSRVDLWLPKKNLNLLVKKGDKLIGGRQIVATYNCIN